MFPFYAVNLGRGLKLKTVHGPHWEEKCLCGPQIKMKKALQAALWSPKYRDMLNYFKKWLSLNRKWIWKDEKKLKSAKKYANIITNLQYLQFMKEITGHTSTSGGPHAASGPRVWDRDWVLKSRCRKKWAR